MPIPVFDELSLLRAHYLEGMIEVEREVDWLLEEGFRGPERDSRSPLFQAGVLARLRMSDKIDLVQRLLIAAAGEQQRAKDLVSELRAANQLRNRLAHQWMWPGFSGPDAEFAFGWRDDSTELPRMRPSTLRRKADALFALVLEVEWARMSLGESFGYAAVVPIRR